MNGLPTDQPQVSVYDLEATESIRKEFRADPHRLRRVRGHFFKRSLGRELACEALDEPMRTAFTDRVRFHSLALVRRFDSGHDGASKLVFQTGEGYAIESIVLRAATGRISLCVSSQVGCAANCAFCATGKMGVAHNLPAESILDQLVHANELLRDEGGRVRNIVFMGMGEPLHNEQSVRQALSLLQSAEFFHHPPSRVLLSTVGLPDAMVSLAKDQPLINYAVSLHSADQSIREQIIPLAKRYPLGLLREAIASLNRIQPEKTSVMIEYLMIDRFNDRPEDAARLIDWLKGLRVHVNLIPYNPIEGAPHLVCSPKERIKRFGATVRSSGVPTTIRYSMGRDIEAACGQLVRRENQLVATRLAGNKSVRS